MGSYFGYSICVVDVNSNGFDDVVVGAPLYSDFETKDGIFEVGRVYVIYQDSEHQFKKRQLLNGQFHRSRFGLSLTSAGDINRDEFGDFVVGAPYGGENGRGVVYIFYGSEHGVQDSTPQVIFAEDVDPNMSTFGFSLSGGSDLDINEYPGNLIVSNKSVIRINEYFIFLRFISRSLRFENEIFFYYYYIFRSRPVVSVSASFTIKPEKINFQDKGCSLLDGTLVSCVVIHLCLEYSGAGVASKMEFEFVTQLDVLKTNGTRVFFLTSEHDHVQNSSAILQKDSIYCKSIFIYVKSALQDKLTPIIVGTNYSLMERKSDLKREVRPILDKNTNSSLRKEIDFKTNFVPDLQLKCESNQMTYLMGSKERLELLINISNAGEDAFETTFYMEIPLGIEYVNILKNTPGILILCIPIASTSNNYQCDIGNYLKANTTVYNDGPSDIVEAEMYILWPTKTLGGQYLLYLLDQPEVSGSGRCDFVPRVNYFNLNVSVTKR
uniref:Uncharacterized protein n=1 Tax=Strigamia maritima TaxID=126957 RepID=T1JAL3_STRMM